MVALDPEFERAAQQLKLWELTSAHVDDGGLGERDVRFLDLYSVAALKKVVKHYGVDERLEQIGLSDWEVELTREDSFHHRLEAFIGKERTDDHRILDLRIHLKRVQVGEGDDEQVFDALEIEWLALQNPRASFSASQPRLPGQRFPGTHLGRTFHNLLMIMTERIGRAALVTTPNRWHLARMYQRGGYRFASPRATEEVWEVSAATRRLRYAAAAWAVERGFVRHEPDGSPYAYDPAQMVLALSPALKMRLQIALQTLREVAHAVAPTDFVVDVEGLAQSLREDPVEGLSPDDLAAGWF